MRNRPVFILLWSVAAAAQTSSPTDFFERHIRPVLAEQCYVCHSENAPAVQGGLRLDTRAAVLQGGHSGPSVIPGKAEQSRLYQALTYEDEGLKMPPQGKLGDEVLARFKQWIEMGAPDPRIESAEDPKRRPRSDHWAFQPPEKTEPPAVDDKRWATNPIDRFVYGRLAVEGLTPSERAKPRTLLRRLSYDLTGLPPTFEELEAFATDPSDKAYRTAVERLLATPRFGERWGRYWLDVARYSDTGFQQRRFPASFHYRDWVIEALNDDLPYDRFVKTQVAADLMDLGDRPKDLRALGFLTMGINLPRPTDVPENLDDRIDVVSRGFLGLTASCARCHDHKFDPIPTSDYYSLYGIFLNSANVIEPQLVDTVYGRPRAEDFQPRLEKRRQDIDDFQLERLEAHKAEFRSKEWLPRYLETAWEGRNYSNTQLEKISRERDLNIYLLKRWQAYVNERVDVGEGPLAQLESSEDARTLALKLAQLDRPKPYGDDREKLRLILRAEGSPTDVPFEDFVWVMDEGDSNVLKNLKWQYNAAFSDWAYQGGPEAAMALRDNEQLEPARIFVRGNQHDKGAEVPRRFLSALSLDDAPFQRGSGRLELAEAIASAENPLTARVAVNRVWQNLFGEGIVRTPSDFGTRGAAPTHPELLDTLATDFVERGWSVKSLIRRIVLSETYRQSSADREDAGAIDPENKLLWRANRRRLDFEALRDSMLAVSGRLEESIGGPSLLLGAQPSTPRRAVYAFIDREAPAKMLKSFDFSNPEQHTAQRIPTTVPQQALFLMNSPFAAEQARAAAERQSDIPSIYRGVLGRRPTADEIELGKEFLEQYQTVVSETTVRPWRYGTARLDPETGGLSGFEELTVWVEDSWRGASMLPAPKTGHAKVTAAGGAPGPGLDHAVVREWTSPIEGEIAITGALNQNVGAIGKRFDYSNGVRGWIVSDRQGILAQWTLKNGKAETALSGIEVRNGEKIAFVVDDRGDDESDNFTWAPVIEHGKQKWDAAVDFAGPAPAPLTAWEAYTQALLATNEFAFVD